MILDAFALAGDRFQISTTTTESATCLGSFAGSERENQDRVALIDYWSLDQSKNFRIYAVADGVGGLAAGGRCAELALATLVQSMIVSRAGQFGIRLIEAIRDANRNVYREFKGDGATTLSVLACPKAQLLTFSSVGDSRIYRYAPDSSPPVLEQLTEDDTIGHQVARAEGRDPSSSPRSGIKGQLTQAIGAEADIDPSAKSIRIEQDDRFLLTTDGLHFVGRDILLRVLQHAEWPVQGFERVSHIARWFGGKDDISAIFAGPISHTVFEDAEPPRHGVLKIQTPFKTSVFTKIGTLLAAEANEINKGKTAASRSRKKKASKKRVKKNTQKAGKSGEKTTDSRKENHATDSADDIAPQQELEIGYVTTNQE